MPAGSQPETGQDPAVARTGRVCRTTAPPCLCRLGELPAPCLGPGAPAACPVQRSRSLAEGGSAPGSSAPRPAPSPEHVGSAAWVCACPVPRRSGAVPREGVPPGLGFTEVGRLGLGRGSGLPLRGVSQPRVVQAGSATPQGGVGARSGLRKSGGANLQCLPPFDTPLCFVNQQELEEIRKCGMKNFRNIQVDEANLLTWQGLIVPVSTGASPPAAPGGVGAGPAGASQARKGRVSRPHTQSGDSLLSGPTGPSCPLCSRPALGLCAPVSPLAPRPPPPCASCCLSPCLASLLGSLCPAPALPGVQLLVA